MIKIITNNFITIINIKIIIIIIQDKISKGVEVEDIISIIITIHLVEVLNSKITAMVLEIIMDTMEDRGIITIIKVEVEVITGLIVIITIFKVEEGQEIIIKINIKVIKIIEIIITIIIIIIITNKITTMVTIMLIKIINKYLHNL